MQDRGQQQPQPRDWHNPTEPTEPGDANYGGPVYREPSDFGTYARQEHAYEQWRAQHPAQHMHAPNWQQRNDQGRGMRGQGSGGQGQGQESWGTQPYYGGYGYDFKGEGFGGQAQGYPNPGFGSRSGQGLGVDAGPHAGKGPKRSDDRIQDDVCRLLTEHGRLDASNVTVSVQHGEVTLNGTVDSRSAKRTAEDVAESVPGVRDIHNRLTIQQQGQGQPQAQSQTQGRAQQQSTTAVH